jgi:hypothetical protein
MRKKQAKAKRESATTGMADGTATGKTRKESRVDAALVERAVEIFKALKAYCSLCRHEALARIEYLDKVRHDDTESEVEKAERAMVRNCYALGASMLCIDRLVKKEPVAFVAGSAMLISKLDSCVVLSVAEDWAMTFIGQKRDEAIDSCPPSLDELTAIQEAVAKRLNEIAESEDGGDE